MKNSIHVCMCAVAVCYCLLLRVVYTCPGLRQNFYDGVEEFWVVLRETGCHEATLTKEERHASSEKAA